MAQNSAGGVGFGSIVSSLFGGDAGKKPGLRTRACRARAACSPRSIGLT